jgi:heme/copper-type cytochrome/quinol oxidase subunit 2
MKKRHSHFWFCLLFLKKWFFLLIFAKKTYMEPLELYENEESKKRVILTSWILLGFYVMYLLIECYYYTLIQSVFAGTSTQSEVEAYDTYTGIFAILYLIVFTVSGVAFINWFDTLYKNLGRAGGHQSYNEYWTKWAWFVPIMNVYVPYKMMKETHHNMQLLRENEPTAKPFPVLGSWWFVFIVSNAINRVAARWEGKAETEEQFLNATTLSIIGDILLIIEIVLFISVVKGLSEEEAKLDQYIINMAMADTENKQPDQQNPEETDNNIWV